MAPRTLTFATALTPDPALQQSARYLFDNVDRQSIDNQIRALQTFASVDHLNAKGGTYVSFVGADGAVGDVVCSAGGLGGKPTVQLATAANLVLSGVMFGILAEACVEGNKAHVVHSGILGPEVTGLAEGDEGWVRVTDNRCEKVALLADVDICVGWVDSGGFLRVGAQPIASVTTTFPPTAFYILNSASVPAALTNGVPGLNLTSTLIFASTSVAPLEMRRTDAATADDVDVGYLEALSAGTTAANFGPAWRFYAKKGAGGSETTGTLSMVWTNVGAGTEASKFVVKTRSAGGAAAAALAVSETEITATALAGVGTRFVTVTAGGVLGAASAADSSAKYVTDASATVNANDVPLRAMTGTLEYLSTARPVGFAHETAAAGTTELVRHRRTITAAGLGLTGTGGYDSWWIPDGAGTEVEAFRLDARWNQVVGPYAEVAFWFDHNGVVTERIVFSSAGGITTPGIITGANFVGVSLDRATAGALTLGGTNATSIAGSGLPFTGVLSIDNSAGTIAVGANTTSQSFGKAGTAASFLGANTLTEATTLSALTTGVVHAGVAGLLSSSTIVNADVSASAAIAGTKIDPAFGAQNVSQTGATSITAGSVGFIGPKVDTAAGALTLAVAGTTREVIGTDGGHTESKDDSAVDRVQHGTAGVNYVDRTGLATTVTASTTATIYTIATVSNSIIKVEVNVFAFDTTSFTASRVFGIRRQFKNVAGTITDGTANDIHALDDLGTAWGTPPTLAIDSSGTDIRVRGTASSNDTRFVIAEVKVFAITASA